MKRTFKKVLIGLIAVSAISLSSNSTAAIVQYGLTTSLSESQDLPSGLFLIQSSIRDTALKAGDSFRININFSDNDRLIWADNGSNREWVGLFMAPETSSTFEMTSDALFTFLNPVGDFTNSHLKGDSNAYEECCIGNASQLGTNITDGQFSISGISVELNNLRPLSNSKRGGLPATFSKLNLVFSGGDFSIKKGHSIEVAEPGALSLVGLGLIGSIVTRRRKKQA